MSSNVSLQPSVYEQLMLELINRARSNPNAEAALYDLTDLNQGLSPGTITSDPKQPLAFNLLLIDAAREHSQWISDTNTFSHTGEGGSNPGDRMIAAGYNFTGSWGWGENIAWKGTTWTPNVTQYIADEHRSLFLSDGHRSNILRDSFREIGIGAIEDTYTHANNITYNAVITTQNFAYSGSSVFLTGVAFDDLVTDDDFYTIGEAIGGIEVKVIRQSDDQIFTTHTMSAGGYQIALSAGTYDVEFFQDGTKIGNTQTVTINSQNVKLDLDTSNINTLDDFLQGTNADYEQIKGFAGNDTLIGLGGADELWGGNDHDVLNGGEGQDSLYGHSGNDKLYGGNANDLLNGGEGQDSLYGNLGDDKLYGGNDHDLLNGGEGQDSLYGQSGNDSLYGGNDHDLLNGGDGRDTLYGNLGNDKLYGGNDHDVLNGSDGRDSLYGNLGNDKLYGGNDHDVLNGSDGQDSLYGQSGNDSLYGGDGQDDLYGNLGNDKLYGGNDHDVLNGGDGQDSLYGNLGNDKLYGGNANDLLNGGDGQDTLYGNFGNDQLYGGNANDVLNGGQGQDTLTGGADMDLFVIQPDMGQDLIQDFEDGVDRITLSGNLSFGNLAIFDDPEIIATIIQDNRTNDVLAVLSGVDSSLITETDFTV